MPEWIFPLQISFWAQSEEEANEISQNIGEEIFSRDDVLTVEAPFSPTWLKDDE